MALAIRKYFWQNSRYYPWQTALVDILPAWRHLVSETDGLDANAHQLYLQVRGYLTFRAGLTGLDRS